MTVKGLPAEYRPLTPPMDHQAEAVALGWNREYFAYLLEMGLGKSRVLIDDFCLNYELGKIDALLVVAPKSVYTNWTRRSDDNPGELQKWLWGEAKTSAIVHTYRAGKMTQDRQAILSIMDITAPGPRILVVNIEAISSTVEAVYTCEKFLRSHRTMLVVDESTAIKDRTSKRTKKLMKMSELATKRRILTGSPVTGSPTDLWGQFEFLKRGSLGFGTFTAFQSRFCLLRDMRIGPRVIRKEYGTQNLDELRDIVKQHSIRFRKDRLNLPPKLYEPAVNIDLTDEQKRAYEEMKRSAMATVRGADVTTTIVMTQLMRLHQILCGHITTDDGRVIYLDSRRADAMIDVIEQSGDRSVVIWCCYRPDATTVVRKLEEKYGEGCAAIWTGGETMDDREAGEAAFQAGEKRFMVATQSAGAKGRTWTRGTLVIYYTNSYDLELREQSEDRTHRIGQTGSVTYVDLITQGTVEEKIVTALRNKKNVARLIQEDGFSQWI